MTIEKSLRRRRALDRRRGVLTLEALPFRLESLAYNLGRPGACYIAAYRIACDMAGHGVVEGCLRIAQGVVTCRHAPSEWCGKSIMHAWVEWKVNGFWLVVDGSRPGHQVWLGAREDYYKSASVVESDVWFYSFQESIQMAGRFEHYGPWRKPKVSSDDWTHADEAKVDVDGFYVDP